MSVTVRGLVKGGKGYTFGDTGSEVFVNYTQGDYLHETYEESSISLLSSADQATLFTFQVNDDDDPIKSTFRSPALGYAQRVLARDLPNRNGQDYILRTLSHVSCAFAILLQEHFCVENTFNMSDRGSNPTYYGPEMIHPYADQDRLKLLQATMLLWADDSIDMGDIEAYVKLYRGQALQHIDEPPPAILGPSVDWFRDMDAQEMSAIWHNLLYAVRKLSVLIAAFARIINLRAASDLPLCEDVILIGRSELGMRVERWNGKDEVGLHFDAFFEVVAILMKGQVDDLDLTSTGLISECGWSLLYGTFADTDPALTGSSAITYGIPLSRD